MKLSNQQITALANNIYKKVKENNTESNKKINEENAKLPLKLLSKSTVTILLDYFHCTGNTNTNHYLSQYAKAKFPDKFQQVKSEGYGLENEIKNEIILNTIECDNLQDLIDKVTKKFS